MFKKPILILLTVSLTLGAAGSLSAQTGLFFDEFGASYKATAMGQAFTAVANDYSAAYYNPAGLTQIKNIFENATGYIYARPLVSAHFPGHDAIDIDGQPASRGLFTGIASSLDIEETIKVFPWFRRFSFGLVSWMNLPEINQYHAGPIASRPHFLRHDLRFQLLALVISMGFEVTPWFSVGAGVIPSLDSYADQDAFAATNNREDGVMGLRLSIHQTAEFFVVPVFGVLIKPPAERLRDLVAVGVSYRGENKGHHGKGPLHQVIGVEDENGEPTWGFLYPKTLTINLVSFAPRQVTAGIAFRPGPGLTFAYDMTWKQYSRYQTYLEISASPAFSDTFTHRFGAEYTWAPAASWPLIDRIKGVALRAGYYYEPTPVGNVYGTDNIFDTDQHVPSAGVCVTVAEEKMEHSLEFFYQHHFFVNRTRPAYMDSVYAILNNIEISDEYIPVEIGGHVWAIGANYLVRF